MTIIETVIAELERSSAGAKHIRAQYDRTGNAIETAIAELEAGIADAQKYIGDLEFAKNTLLGVGDQIAIALSDQQKLFPATDETTMRIEEIAASIAPNGKGKEAKP